MNKEINKQSSGQRAKCPALKTRKRSWVKSMVSATLIAACTQFATANTDDSQSYTRFTGPGLDYTAWSGSLLVGPGHSLWGVRIGYLKGNRLVTARDVVKDVARAGAYAEDRTYAELDLTHYFIRWAKLSNSTMLAEITPRKDQTLVAEVYPSHHNVGNQKIPMPIVNPAKFAVGSDGIITGTSQHIDTVAGHTRITGGNAIFKNRSVSIAPASSGLDHFRMETFPKPTKTLDSEMSARSGYSTDGRNRSCAVFDAKKAIRFFLLYLLRMALLSL